MKRRNKKFGRLAVGRDVLLPGISLVPVGSPGALPLPSKFINSIPCALGCMLRLRIEFQLKPRNVMKISIGEGVNSNAILYVHVGPLFEQRPVMKYN